MLMRSRPVESQSQRRTELFIWIAVLYAAVLYAVVMKLAPARGALDNPTLVSVFLIASLALVAISLAIRSRFNERARESRHPEGLRRVGFLVGLAVCESAALVGVVSWFVTGSPRSYWMVLFGFLGLLAHYPKREGET